MRYCSKCGNKLKDDQLYCPKCGNKEPFLKNTKQSSWKDFDKDDASKVTNVNYDFQTPNSPIAQQPGKPIKPTKPRPTSKGLDVFAKIIRIYCIIYGIFCGVTCIVSFAVNITGRTGNWLAITCLVLSSLELLSIIALTIAAKCTKNWNPITKNIYLSTLMMSVIMVGLTIGQYFLTKRAGFNPMGFVEMGLMIGVNGILSPFHSFKKTAR